MCRSLQGRATRSGFAVVLLLLAALTSLLVQPRESAGAEPYNVIIFLADDLGWNDLPYFSPPIDWGATPATTWPNAKGESHRVRGDLNRFAARAYANSNGTKGAYIDAAGKSFDVLAADQKFASGAPTPNYTSRAVVCQTGGTPCADNNDCGSIQTADKAVCAQAPSDILPGFGGLKRLVDTGAIFPRFYANSSKCAPSRAALFTGRYPKSVGVTLNGGEIDGDEMTIAEYLKQGCAYTSTATELKCRADGAPSTSNCKCAFSSATCTGGTLPCYRTGLIGKWHLGGREDHAPWNQGFDEYFGFSGGSRHYWDTGNLDCGPVPRYCSQDGLSGEDLQICTVDSDCAGTQASRCAPRGLYLGTKRGSFGTANQQSFNDCNFTSNTPDCCKPAGKDDSTGRGKYLVKEHLATGSDDAAKPGKGKDTFSGGERPCSDTGLTKNTNCVYLTRVERDHARNFIVRNAQFEPFFLTVAFHAPHFGFAAPLRTEDHHKTEIATDSDDEPDPPTEPNNASKYWAIMEELDSAIGEIMTVLDRTGVCANDPSKACDGTCTCLDLGRAGPDYDDTPCASGSSCKPLSDRTLVFFVSDQGRPHGGSNYGSPDLRGGKGDVYDGGIRSTMMVRHPLSPKGLCSTATPRKYCDPNLSGQCAQSGDGVCQERTIVSPVTASIVDLFPTIAEAAGFSVDAAGRVQLTNDATPLKTDGRSFYDAILDPIPASLPATGPRVYASYPSDGMTVVTSEGDSVNTGTSGVCGYDTWTNVTTPPNRRVMGASCKSCTNNGDCSSQWCKLPGRACVPTGNTTGCPSGGVCFTTAFYSSTSLNNGYLRCKQSNSECPQGYGLSCKANVWVACNTCAQDPIWKLRTPSAATSAPGGELYDLRTNPEEENAINCLGAAGGPDSAGVVSNALFDGAGIGLSDWNDCTGNSNEDYCPPGAP